MEGPIYFPVLDGPDPKEWKPWGKRSFHDLKEGLRQNPIDLPDEIKEYSKVSLDLLDQSRDDLFDDDEEKWIRYIGVIVDVRTSDLEKRKEVEKDFGRILAKVRASSESYYRTVGFYLLAVVSLAGEEKFQIPQEQIDLSYSLERQARQSLGEAIVIARVIPEEGAFVGTLHSVNSEIVQRYIWETR
jgi:hypothetical protein